MQGATLQKGLMHGPPPPACSRSDKRLLSFLVSLVTCSSAVPKARSRPVIAGQVQVERAEEREQRPEAAPIVPSLSHKSLLLSEELCKRLHAALPAVARSRQWMLVYRDGISLLTLYRKSHEIAGPCLLVTGDSQGAVFGALVAAPLVPSPSKKYQGNSSTFVFTDVDGTPKVFRATGANRYYVLCTSHSLALGGGGSFALYVDGELLTGSSGESETFANSRLSHADEFTLKEVELWGFKHAPGMQT